MNLDEALNTIIDLAKTAAGPKLTAIELNDAEKILFDGSELHPVKVPAPMLKRTATTLASFSALLDRFGTTLPTVFVGDDAIVAVLDDDDRRELLECPFELSTEVKMLKRLADGIDQKGLVRSLRTALAGCCTNEQIVSVFARLQFRRRNDGTATVEHGRESLGRDVERQVQSPEHELPEILVFRMPLLLQPADIASDVEIRVAVDIDVDHERIALIPIGDSISRQFQQLQRQIAERLGENADVTSVTGEVTAIRAAPFQIKGS